jgi:transcriptional regulator with XRE-family HTH domain
VIIIEHNEGYAFRFPFHQLDGMTNIHKARIKNEDGTTFIYFYDREIKEELFRDPQNMKIVVAERRLKKIESLPIYKYTPENKPLRQHIGYSLRNELIKKIKPISKDDLDERVAIVLGCSKSYAKKILIGNKPLRTEYILILAEQYDLSLDAIFFGKEKELKIRILEKMQDLMRNDEEYEVGIELKVLLRKIFTRIDNAKTREEKINICDDLMDVLERDDGHDM